MLRSTGRAGFTLIEMLVAMALTLFVMTILSQAFVAGLTTFSGLKAIGDTQAALRVAMDSLRADLTQDHFEGKRRLSDPNMLTDAPKSGYFYVKHPNGNAPAVLEGVDADNVPSFRGTDHLLAFTIKLRGNRKENFLTTNDIPSVGGKWSPLSLNTTNFWNQDRDQLLNPGGPALLPSPPAQDIYASQWAEIGYALVATGSTDDVSVNAAGTGTRLYALYRTQYLLVPNPTTANQTNDGTTADGLLTAGAYAGISCFDSNPATANNPLTFNSPEDVADTTGVLALPPTTIGMQKRIALQTNRKGALVAKNVVSFEVQLLFAGAPDFLHAQGLNTVPPSVNPPIRVFDTSLIGALNSNGVPFQTTQIMGIKITLRVFDPTMGYSRQISLVQDL